MAVNPNLSIRYADVDLEYEAVLSDTPPEDDGPVWMVNLMKYRERAEYLDGRETDLTGQQADDRYAPFEAFAEVGAELVFLAEVDTQLLGDEPKWDRVAVVKYPTRRAFADMSHIPVFEEKHVHKDAGMEQTIVMGSRPVPWPAIPDDAPSWDDVPHPPTDEDGSVVVIHVLKFEDDAPSGIDRYTEKAALTAVPHGVRISGWFGVEGTILGDGRQWDQVRFNAFPSREAFMAVALDPDRLAAQAEHRETALADTYTMIVRPVIDHLSDSVAADKASPSS